MSDRTEISGEPRPPRRRPDVRRRARLRPSLDGLEGRALMSYGGSPDFTFGTYGFAANPVPAKSDIFSPVASATQSDGKIVEAGNLTVLGTNSAGASSYYVALARFDADGTLDTTFGTGGYFTDPALSLDNTLAGSSVESANALAIQPDGAIVAVGSNNGGGVAIRLSPNGTLDSTFGTGGVVALGNQQAVGGKLIVPQSVAVLPDGQVALSAKISQGTMNPFPAVVLLNADGSSATGFGTSGQANVPLPVSDQSFEASLFFSVNTDLVAQPDGKMILVTNSIPTNTFDYDQNQILATRFNADGTLDTTFGTAGQVLVSPQTIRSTSPEFQIAKQALQPDGKLVIASSVVDYSSNISINPVVLRLGANGTIDTTFGVRGFDILASNLYQNKSNAPAIAIQADGKIVLASASNDNFSRLNPDGLPDPSFGTGGTTAFPIASTPLANGALSYGVSVLADGKIVALVHDNKSGSVGLVRLLGQGAVNDFNNDGISDPAVLNLSPSSVSYLPSGGGAVVTDAIGDDDAGLTIPAPGTYSGGGVTEQAVYLTGFGAFDIKPYNGGGDVKTLFGTPGFGKSYPAPGDYDKSGKTELAVYEPAAGAFFYRPAYRQANGFGMDVAVPFGVAGTGQSIPAPADYFNTGQTDFAVYLVQQGAFEIRNPVTGQDITIPFGTPGAGQAIPEPGDYDGSGHVELAVYVPASGDLIYRPAGGGPDVIVPFGVAGIATTLPSPGDYDGSGKTEVAGYLPGQGKFSYLPAAGGAAVVVPLGTANQTVAFSLGTDSVAESGIGPPPPSPNVLAPSVEVPLTPDVLDALAGPLVKKKAGNA